jgi:hypothetical protein
MKKWQMVNTIKALNELVGEQYRIMKSEEKILKAWFKRIKELEEQLKQKDSNK